MGQCTFQDGQSNYFGNLFNSQVSEQGSFLSKQNNLHKESAIWEHQLYYNLQVQLPDKKFWNQPLNLIHPCFEQITKDITRTFPQSDYFGNKNNLQNFQNVLRKFSLYFPKVGYTQGLNFIAGFIMLSDCEQKKCFDLLVKLMINDRILAIGLFEDDFPLNKLYCQMFWLILQKKQANLCQKLKKLHIPDELWLFQWFITMFLYKFPLEYSQHFWEFIIFKKQFAPVLLAYGIIKSLKHQIMKLQMLDQMDFFEYIQQLRDVNFCRKYLDLKKIFAGANSISKNDLNKTIYETSCIDNPYRIYFMSTPAVQKELWHKILIKLEKERLTFNSDPEAKRYQRATDIIQHLEKIAISKYRLYKSQFKRSNGSFCNKSNMSLPFSIRSLRNPNKTDQFINRRF